MLPAASPHCTTAVRQLVCHDFLNNFNELAATFALWWCHYAFKYDTTSSLDTACRYALECPGKRVRPVLALAAGELAAIEAERLRPFALALELTHTASLIHDDLPALDNDDLRRGRATVHKVFGEGMAVLVGDFLFAEAFWQVTHDRSLAPIAPLFADVVKAIQVGQALDLQPEHNADREGSLWERHRRKTAALIALAVAGPLLLEPRRFPEEDFLKLWGIGVQMGLLFQLTDDLLDAEGSSAEAGKHVASDARLDRESAVAVLGIAEAHRRAAALADGLYSEFSAFHPRAEFLAEFSRSLVGRRA